MSTAIEPRLDLPFHTWFSQDDRRADFAARLAREITIPADQLQQLNFGHPISSVSRSQQTSTIVHSCSEYDLDSMASHYVPALTRGNSIASSSVSATSTGMASVVDGGCVLELENGVLTAPTRNHRHSDLLCPFEILECHEIFADSVDFKVHVFSHFRGHKLPPYAPCFVCGLLFFQRAEDDHALAWNNLLDHMAHAHYRSGQREVVIKPDIAIMRYMWNRRIITDTEFKRTQEAVVETRLSGTNHERDGIDDIPEVPMAPSAPMPLEIRQHLNQSMGLRGEAFTISAGRRQERRQVDRLRLVTRVRGNL